MALRSKVWPALVRSSLNLAPVESPTERIQFSYRPQRRHQKQPRKFLGLTARSLRHHFRRSPTCNPSASDIFCVAGAITVITGSLVATFGVFPRNQARIRLYLECVGCAMVIVGVLIVFASQKMRTRLEDQRGDQLETATRSLAMANRLAAFQQRASKFDTFQIDSPSRETVAACHVIGVDLDEDEDMEDSLAGVMELAQLKPVAASVGVAVEHLRLRRNATTAEASSWIPDEDSHYGHEHLAALEAALSLVLTVSTLAGYRPDQGTEAHHHCCLHHAVQHKLQASRWLSRFRRSHQQQASRRTMDASAAAAETTLTLVATAVGGNLHTATAATI